MFDTKSAILKMVKEENNSEASAIMAALKRRFEGLPCWLIGHVSKAHLTRADVVGLSLRGASAFEADAHQVLYLMKAADERYLVRGKTRFEGRWPELLVRPGFAEVSATDEFGHSERVFLRWGIASPPRAKPQGDSGAGQRPCLQGRCGQPARRTKKRGGNSVAGGLPTQPRGRQGKGQAPCYRRKGLHRELAVGAMAA